MGGHGGLATLAQQTPAFLRLSAVDDQTADLV
jgi:hypothetical protein